MRDNNKLVYFYAYGSITINIKHFESLFELIKKLLISFWHIRGYWIWFIYWDIVINIIVILWNNYKLIKEVVKE
jgi:hypothetical protein